MTELYGCKVAFTGVHHKRFRPVSESYATWQCDNCDFNYSSTSTDEGVLERPWESILVILDFHLRHCPKMPDTQAEYTDAYERGCLDQLQVDQAYLVVAKKESFRRGAEAMREKAVEIVETVKLIPGSNGILVYDRRTISVAIRALPIPEDAP